MRHEFPGRAWERRNPEPLNCYYIDMITRKEREKYDRQIRIDGLGTEGQEKLKQARVLIAGVGGLGSPLAVYLAIAGVGNLRIVDNDEVSLSNLNRQPLYGAEDIGRKKTEAAELRLQKLNPDIKVEAVFETITEETVSQLADGCDLILDAVDNFPARYVLNNAAIKKGVPFLYGGIYGLEGTMTTIIPRKTACLRCIFPDPPPSEIFPVLGSTAGILGCIQAMEAIKYIVGIGDLMTNRLLIFDGFSMKFREVRVESDPQCPDCSPSAGS